MAQQIVSYHVHQMIYKCALRGFPCGTVLTQVMVHEEPGLAPQHRREHAWRCALHPPQNDQGEEAYSILKWISEMETEKSIAGIFLLAYLFWSGNGWRYSGYEELMQLTGRATHLSKGSQIFLYHCRDDATLPLDHLALYAQILPEATVCEREEGGHQFNNNLSFVAEDIKSLQL